MFRLNSIWASIVVFALIWLLLLLFLQFHSQCQVCSHHFGANMTGGMRLSSVDLEALGNMSLLRSPVAKNGWPMQERLQLYKLPRCFLQATFLEHFIYGLCVRAILRGFKLFSFIRTSLLSVFFSRREPFPSLPALFHSDQLLALITL
jgi:hypothetical protein